MEPEIGQSRGIAPTVPPVRNVRVGAGLKGKAFLPEDRISTNGSMPEDNKTRPYHGMRPARTGIIYRMTYDPQRHHRHSIRLKGYDYTRAGAYFVTICAQERVEIFGNIVNGDMDLNAFGHIVQTAWFDLPRHYPHIQLDAFCIMPNHVHGIIVFIDRHVGAGLKGDMFQPDKLMYGKGSMPEDNKTRPYDRIPKIHPLSEIVRAFKSFSARRINRLRKTRGLPVWQRNYFETILRNENHYNRIRTYILENPRRWQEDPLHPSAPTDG
jgi:putative transposase